MVIAYCANRSIYHLLPTTLNSLLTNNSNISKIYLIIEDDEIPFIRHPKIKFINCNQFDFILRDGLNITKRFTYMALARCILSKILKEDKIIYLDVDTIVDGSLNELWNTTLGQNLISGVFEAEGYCNSGVMLMDLRKIRLGKYDDSLLRMLKFAKLLLPDQDAINLIFKGKIKELDKKFNALGRHDHVYGKQEIIIRHFAGIVKPWADGAATEDIEFWNKYKIEEI